MFFGDCYLSTSAQALGFPYHKRKTHLFEISDFYVTFGFSRNGALGTQIGLGFSRGGGVGHMSFDGLGGEKSPRRSEIRSICLIPVA